MTTAQGAARSKLDSIRTERLSPGDVLWLSMETPEAPMHAGGLIVYENDPLDIDRMLAEISHQLEVIPRMRQRILRVPFGLGRPVWADDGHFDIRHHVHHVVLPPPATEEQLLAFTAKVVSRPLDRARPLWEHWLVDGLPGGRWAQVFKIHHCVLDGEGAVRAFEQIEIPDDGPHPLPEWTPRPIPPRLQLMRDALEERRDALAGRGQEGQPAPRTRKRLRDRARMWQAAASDLLKPAPRVSLNTPIGPYRRYAYVPARLADLKAIRSAVGGTVNDVALAIVAGGLRTWLGKRGELTEGLELKVSCPVSVRTDQSQALGNLLSMMVVPIPVGEADPVAAVRMVAAATRAAKQSGQLEVGESVVRLIGLWSWASGRIANRVVRSQRQFNLSVTNVAGLVFPAPPKRHPALTLAMPILMPNCALAVSVISTRQGDLTFGLVGDYEALPDLDVIADGMRRTIEELTERVLG